MSRQYFTETIAWQTSDGAAIANTTTETAIFAAPTIPANMMADGRVLELIASGKLSTTGTPTITFALRWGAAVSGTLLATTEAITNGSAVTDAAWRVHLLIQTRINGATGTIIAMGHVTVNTSATASVTGVFGVSGWDAPAAVGSLNLTADTALTLGAAWGTQSASNTLTGMMYTLKSLN